MKSFAVPWSFAKRSVAMAPRRPLQCAPLQRQPRPARRSWASAVCIRAPVDDSLRPMFLTSAEAALVRERFGTPCYVYDRASLEAAARAALAFPQAFGFTLRYAMKANPSHAVLRLFRDLGLHIDASSDPEVERALRAGFAPGRIQLTSQVPSRRLEEFVALGVLYNACSLHQLDRYGRAFPERAVIIRVNPGLGSGSTNRTNTGGPASSFGIWHGYLVAVGSVVREAFVDFQGRTGRKLHLEIEPGAYLVANAGAVVATCVDVLDTGEDGYLFAKLDAGMTEVTRPSLYGAQHPITVVAVERPTARVVFVGPCCESGDVLTPAPGDPEALTPREVPRPEIGDLVVVGGAGAYCAAMCTGNYNSYPLAPEVLRELDGSLRLVRRRQSLEQMLANEVE